MESKYFEEQLIPFFSEIIYVDENPHIEIVRETYKQDGQVKYKSTKVSTNLDSFHLSKSSKNILIPECGNFGIIERINEVSEIIQIDFFPKNIFQRIFNKKSKRLILELQSLSFDYLIVNELIYQKIKDKVTGQIYVEKHMSDKVIVGKRGKLYLKKELTSDSDEYVVEFSFDKNQFTTIFLT